MYRLTCYGFDLMRWRSAGRCEICGVDETELHRNQLVIDHDHRLGNGSDHIRGMICHKCNAAMKYVDTGFRMPTRDQLLYIYNAWFWTWIPDERRDEPYIPPRPKSGGSDNSYSGSPHYRRRCLAGRVDKRTMQHWPCPPPQQKKGRDAVLLWRTV